MRLRKLRELLDVSRTPPTNGQVLTYNSTSKLWEAAAGGGGGPSLRTFGTTDYNTLIASAAAYWDFEDNTWADTSPNGNTLTAHGSPVTCLGVLGNAVNFRSASTEYFTIANNAYVQLGDVDWTVALWAYIHVSANMILMGKDGGTRELLIQYNTGTYRFFFGGGTITATEQTPLGGWHFIRAWHTGHVGYLSIDEGEPTTASLTPLAAGTDDLWIGAYPSGQYTDGRIRHAGIFKKVLSSAEVDLLWNNGMGP